MADKKVIYIIGVGPGQREIMTADALYTVATADVLIGAKRMIETADPFDAKAHFVNYKADEIVKYIEEDKEHKSFGVLYSGDIGFYSGATKLTQEIAKMDSDTLYEIVRVPGISAPIYLLDMIGVPWQDAVLVSNHGCETNIINKIRKNKTVATLIGDASYVATVCKQLVEFGMNDITITVGERLSYEDENIRTGVPNNFVDEEFDVLSVAIFENANPEIETSEEIKDDAFIRGAVPMTKQEIRTLSVAKLGLTRDAIVYDVGAGTGSVSVAMAKYAEDGKVYAIEQKEEAKQLILENKLKFACENITLVAGSAPAVLDELPAPSHVFIGGSSGNLIEIIETIRKKNAYAKFVVNAVTIETIGKLSMLAKEHKEYADMELLHVQISRGKQMGEHHLMTSDNGIYIATFGGKSDERESK